MEAEKLSSFSKYSKARLLQKYLLYRWKGSNSKGHGVHSPFVFDFIVNVLNKSHQEIPSEFPVQKFGRGVNRKCNLLLQRLKSYYPHLHIHLVSQVPQAGNLFAKTEKTLDQMEGEDCCFFVGIHHSPEFENWWVEIKKNKKVTCSIDLFFVGILFFKKDFKEKLDFMIRF
jgi:hypothetical protein